MFPASFLLVMLVGWIVPTATAFSSSKVARHAPSLLPRASSLKEPPVSEQFLSDQDEEILFGENDSATWTVSASTGSSIEPPIADPTAARLHQVREAGLTSCPALWGELAQICPQNRALLDEHLCGRGTVVDLTFAEMDVAVRKAAALFSQTVGGAEHPTVAFLAENSARWLIADQGLQYIGGVSAVRGADAPVEELQYIYEHSDAAGVAVLQGPKLLQKLLRSAAHDPTTAPLGLSNEKHGKVRTVILLQTEGKSLEDLQELGDQAGVQVISFPAALEESTPLEQMPQTISLSDVATIVYTSGTTGQPKGVLLRHGNLLHQTSHRLGEGTAYSETEPMPGDCMLSLLPIWHITERSFELWMASRGCAVVYSSIRTFKNDLAKHRPQWLVLVPRVLEKVAAGVQDKFASGSAAVKILSKFFTAVSRRFTRNRAIANGLIVADETAGPLERLAARLQNALLGPLQAVGNKLVWSKVQQGFGGRVKTIISGGSALSGGLEEFYQAAGMPVLVGYGLTECAPLLSFRRSTGNLITPGCAGRPCRDTQLRIVDPETSETVPMGQPGVVWGRGPQVMAGYYKNPKATAEVLKSGWFNTGDLGRINPATGDLILTGRAKDTIVLSNGENIEPTPLEDAITGACPAVDQIMLTGQDGRRLVAVAVLRPAALEDAFGAAAAAKLQAQADLLNDPKCSPEQAAEAAQVLQDATGQLSASLKKSILQEMQQATKGGKFRPWEQVGDVHLVLEPFAMVNGLLTQSYKVKRAAVQEKYQEYLQ